jgi:hypothetical protein
MRFHPSMLWARGYWEQANDGTTGTTGSGSGDAAAAEAAAAAKVKADADAAAAKTKADADAAAAKLTDKEAELLREVMDKKGKLKTVTDDLAKASERLKLFDGLDPEEIKKLVVEAKDRATKDLEAKGQWDALKAQMAEEHTKVMTAVKGELDTVKTELTGAAKKIADLTVGTAFGVSKFVTERLALPISKARALFGSHFEYDGEKVVGYDKPAGATGRVQLVDATGNPLHFDAALEKLVTADPDRDALLKATMKPGASSNTETRTGTPGTQNAGNQQPLAGRDLIAAALAAQKKK